MSNYDFNVGYKKDLPILCMNSAGLSFNRHCIALLGNPEFVNIGLDKENKKLAVIKANPDDTMRRCYRFVQNEQSVNRVTIAATKLCDKILKLTQLRLRRNGIRFLAEFDSANNMLIVDFKKGCLSD